MEDLYNDFLGKLWENKKEYENFREQSLSNLEIKALNFKIDKLKETLKEIDKSWNQHINYDQFPSCNLEWFANRTQYLVTEALRNLK